MALHEAFLQGPHEVHTECPHQVKRSSGIPGGWTPDMGSIFVGAWHKHLGWWPFEDGDANPYGHDDYFVSSRYLTLNATITLDPFYVRRTSDSALVDIGPKVITVEAEVHPVWGGYGGGTQLQGAMPTLAGWTSAYLRPSFPENSHDIRSVLVEASSGIYRWTEDLGASDAWDWEWDDANDTNETVHFGANQVIPDASLYEHGDLTWYDCIGRVMRYATPSVAIASPTSKTITYDTTTSPDSELTGTVEVEMTLSDEHTNADLQALVKTITSAISLADLTTVYACNNNPYGPPGGVAPAFLALSYFWGTHVRSVFATPADGLGDWNACSGGSGNEFVMWPPSIEVSVIGSVDVVPPEVLGDGTHCDTNSTSVTALLNWNFLDRVVAYKGRMYWPDGGRTYTGTKTQSIAVGAPWSDFACSVASGTDWTDDVPASPGAVISYYDQF